ncbi:MAG: corrinoid protein [Fidelibacterota bacterium]|nr:MAG: corrinoid protein [Candidatus Neomarinimicrobiota bacterium]
MEVLAKISEALQRGDEKTVSTLTKQALDSQVPPREILDNGLVAGMDVVGRQFAEHAIFLPEVLMAARAMYAGLDLVKPLMEGEDIPSAGKIVLGTVQGDLHDIGKNLVGIMLRGAGMEVVDLGKDVPAERFVETAASEDADLIGMSALLTTTAPVMQEVIDLLRERNLQGKIRTIIGGAPVTDRFAEKIGADAYAFDAARAVEVVKQMVSGDQ